MADTAVRRVLATLDSKHDAIRFVCDALDARPAPCPGWSICRCARTRMGSPTFAGAEVARAAGTSWEALAKLSRADAAQAMIAGGIKLVQAKQKAGGIAGVLGFGGANGSTMACAIMRALPLAFPEGHGDAGRRDRGGAVVCR